jgi:hypothetical protein
MPTATASLGKKPSGQRKPLPAPNSDFYDLYETLNAADVGTALCWGPGLRWGIMGQVLLNHLGGGEGGIEHFFQQFTGPLTAWSKVLGSPQLTPELQQKLIDGVRAEVSSRSVDELASQRDEVLLGLLELRLRAEQA